MIIDSCNDKLGKILSSACADLKRKQETKNTLESISDVFWISDKEIHRQEVDRKNGNCCFNHQIGLPISKIVPHKEMPIFGYEIDIINNIERHKDYLLNKARGIGATELILRWILFKAVHNNTLGRKFLIITGIRHELAKDYLKRMENLCQKIPHTKKENSIVINQSEIIAIPANPSDIRGYENVGVIFADEAAHWNLLDDESVLQAIEPHRSKSDPHIIIVSTPNGSRGFFSKIFHNPQTRYYKDVKPWNVSEGLLISRDKVKKIRKEDVYRYEQEYNCQFLSSRYAVFPQSLLEAARQKSVEYQLSD